MIRTLHLQDVGPARELKFDFASRLNVLTGDNGLGKTFVLDVVWWVLTTTWAGEIAFPRRIVERGAADDGGVNVRQMSSKIEATLSPRVAGLKPSSAIKIEGTFDLQDQTWSYRRPDRPFPAFVSDITGPVLDRSAERPPGLVVYVRHDGSFALWDAFAVNRYIRSVGGATLLFTPDELWEGKRVPDGDGNRGPPLCRGLVEDWRSWQMERDPTFAWLRSVLDALSEPGEPIVSGEPVRFKIADDRKIPTLSTSYGEVPVTLASAGVKRILGIAYLLVWAWQRHTAIATLQMRAPTSDMVVLIDEVELHLHPQWQRTILPALLKAVGAIAPNTGVQVLATTHAPLVLASLESVFQEDQDSLFVMERDGRIVHANELPFSKEGDVSAWLASDVFKRVGGRSREAELAVDAAMHFMAGRAENAEVSLRALYERLRALPTSSTAMPPGLDLLVTITHEAYSSRPLVDRVHDALKCTLPGHDEFWVHWTLIHRPGREAESR